MRWSSPEGRCATGTIQFRGRGLMYELFRRTKTALIMSAAVTLAAFGYVWCQAPAISSAQASGPGLEVELIAERAKVERLRQALRAERLLRARAERRLDAAQSRIAELMHVSTMNRDPTRMLHPASLRFRSAFEAMSQSQSHLGALPALRHPSAISTLIPTATVLDTSHRIFSSANPALAETAQARPSKAECGEKPPWRCPRDEPNWCRLTAASVETARDRQPASSRRLARNDCRTTDRCPGREARRTPAPATGPHRPDRGLPTRRDPCSGPCARVAIAAVGSSGAD